MHDPFGALRPDPQALAQTLERLKLAGIVAWYLLDGPDRVVIAWTTEYRRLLEAGRRPMSEPELAALFAAGDPVAVRWWVHREAARLRTES